MRRTLLIVAIWLIAFSSISNPSLADDWDIAISEQLVNLSEVQGELIELAKSYNASSVTRDYCNGVLNIQTRVYDAGNAVQKLVRLYYTCNCDSDLANIQMTGAFYHNLNIFSLQISTTESFMDAMREYDLSAALYSESVRLLEITNNLKSLLEQKLEHFKTFG